MQIFFGFFWEDEKLKKKWKMGLNGRILDFEGRSPFYGSHGPWIFSDFLGEFRSNPIK